MPTKLYDDARVKEEKFDLFNLPGKRTAAVSEDSLFFLLFGCFFI